jgi:hypothetical protein
MKLIRDITIMVGLSVALFAMGVTGARGEIPYSTHLAGTFTLPFEAQWGKLTMPAGEYTLQYGTQESGHGLVVVRSAAKGSPYGMILARPTGQTSATKNALICVREGNTLYVRALEMPLIGESVRFRIPHGVEVRSRFGPIEKAHNQGGKNQFVQVAIRTGSVTVK